MADLKIYAQIVWIKEDGDCSNCIACGDIIFGNKYKIGIKICEKTEIIKGGLCESCADAVRNKNDNP